MSSEHAEEVRQPQPTEPQRSQIEQPATVIVRGEAVNPQSSLKDNGSPANTQKTPGAKRVSEAKAKLQSRLPALDDHNDVGVQKEFIVVRDGKPDLMFNGTLLASAAPDGAIKGRWDEFRVYQTSAGKHVFSKMNRTIFADEQDTCEAQVFDPDPQSAAAQLLRSAHELTHSKPKTWQDAAVGFFGYEPLAKELYRKLGNEFEERVS
jgi:hypothetical protein